MVSQQYSVSAGSEIAPRCWTEVLLGVWIGGMYPDHLDTRPIGMAVSR